MPKDGPAEKPSAEFHITAAGEPVLVWFDSDRGFEDYDTDPLYRIVCVRLSDRWWWWVEEGRPPIPAQDRLAAAAIGIVPQDDQIWGVL